MFISDIVILETQWHWSLVNKRKECTKAGKRGSGYTKKYGKIKQPVRRNQKGDSFIYKINTPLRRCLFIYFLSLLFFLSLISISLSCILLDIILVSSFKPFSCVWCCYLALLFCLLFELLLFEHCVFICIYLSLSISVFVCFHVPMCNQARTCFNFHHSIPFWFSVFLSHLLHFYRSTFKLTNHCQPHLQHFDLLFTLA